MVLQPLLEQLPSAARSVLYMDDYCGLCTSETAAAETLQAFEQALSTLPGQFAPKHLSLRDAREGFVFLGYEIRLTETGDIHFRISDEAFDKMLGNCWLRAWRGDTQEEIRTYIDRWSQGYGLAQLDDGDRMMMHSAEDAWSMVRQEQPIPAEWA
jgi:hypothetical protein